MVKEVRGWREPEDWDYKGDDPFVAKLMKTGQSDDGWVCPHCGFKETPKGISMSRDDLLNLYLWDTKNRVEMLCRSCGKEYFVKCFTRFMYFSCADKKFEKA